MQAERVVRAPAPGVFTGSRRIGDQVIVGDVLGRVGQTPVPAPLSGVLRGLIHDGVRVDQGLKIGDIDPRGEVNYCYTISEKSLASAGGFEPSWSIYTQRVKTHMSRNLITKPSWSASSAIRGGNPPLSCRRRRLRSGLVALPDH
jgi:hypothetical protein